MGYASFAGAAFPYKLSGLEMGFNLPLELAYMIFLWWYVQSKLNFFHISNILSINYTGNRSFDTSKNELESLLKIRFN